MSAQETIPAEIMKPNEISQELMIVLKDLNLKKTPVHNKVTPTSLKQLPSKIKTFTPPNSFSRPSTPKTKHVFLVPEKDSAKPRKSPKSTQKPSWDDSFAAIHRQDYSANRSVIPIKITPKRFTPNAKNTTSMNSQPLRDLGNTKSSPESTKKFGNNDKQVKTPNVINKQVSFSTVNSSGSPVTPHPRFLKSLNVNPLRGYDKENSTPFQKKLNQCKLEDLKQSGNSDLIQKELEIKSIEYNHLAETVEIQKSQIHRLELELEIKSDKIFETEKELESSFALIAELRSKLNYKEKE